MPVSLSAKGHRTDDVSKNVKGNLTQAQAKTDFQALCTLVGRHSRSDVQIKILHTTDQDKAMQLDTKGWFGRKFSKSTSMVKSNAAILALVERSGVPLNSPNYLKLQAYLSRMTSAKRAGSARGLHAYLEAVKREILQKPALPVATAVSVQDALKAQGYVFSDLRNNLGTGGGGSVVDEVSTPESSPKGVVYKKFHAISDASLPRLEVIADGAGAYTLDRTAKDITAAYLSNDKIPHLARPLAYVVEDTLNQEFHVISADHLKSWGAQHGHTIASSDAGRFMIRGQVLQQAEGLDGDNLRGLNAHDKLAIAQQGLHALKAMAQHGYVHGDIKPANLVYSADKQLLQLIDFDGLQKHSKHDVSGAALGSPLSPEYVIPSTHHVQGANRDGGYGQEADLYAFGLTLLKLFLPGVPETQALLNASRNNDREAVVEQIKQLQAKTALVVPGSPEQLAVLLLQQSLQLDAPQIARWVPESANQLWDPILNHPLMLAPLNP